MKTYKVLVTPEAELGVISALRYIEEHSPFNAEKWLRGLYSRIDTLEQMPSRCARAREAQYFGEELRQLIFKSHRIVFRIEEKALIVRVL
jgi:hypothetical protein